MRVSSRSSDTAANVTVVMTNSTSVKLKRNRKVTTTMAAAMVRKTSRRKSHMRSKTVNIC